MSQAITPVRFQARLLRPTQPGRGADWGFVVLPREVSAALPRRGRTTVDGELNGHAFQAMLEPDGQLGHWLKLGRPLRDAAGVEMGDLVQLAIRPARPEPEPRLPADLSRALAAAPAARRTWDVTTTLARVDWIHWITSAKQARTRAQRIANACDMLASGKKRVCCFDPSGYYSKSFHAPETAP